jgi:poly(3-hydroxybutyrate) depolymerase
MDDSAFTRALLARTLRSVCVKLDSIHVTGISAGGMMTYQTAIDLSPVLASAAPIAGSRIYGYNAPPRSPVSLLEVHGYYDQTVPANASNGLGGGPAGAAVSEDHFYYTEVPYITRAFADAAGCAGPNRPYPTPFDGIAGFQCNMPHGACGERSIVQCIGNWAHTWPLHVVRPFAYARLVLGFFAAHPFPSTAAAEADAAVSRLLACEGGNGTLAQALREAPPGLSDQWTLQRGEVAFT